MKREIIEHLKDYLDLLEEEYHFGRTPYTSDTEWAVQQAQIIQEAREVSRLLDNIRSCD